MTDATESETPAASPVDETPVAKSPHLAWHRDTFGKRTEVELVSPKRQTKFGYRREEIRTKAKLPSARSVIVQRAMHLLTPDEMKTAQAAFDASDEGKHLEATDAHVRREHALLWLTRKLHDTDHESLVPASELALQRVLAHHATQDKVVGHKARLLELLAAKPAKTEATPATSTHS